MQLIETELLIVKFHGERYIQSWLILAAEGDRKGKSKCVYKAIQIRAAPKFEMNFLEDFKAHRDHTEIPPRAHMLQTLRYH